MSGLTMGLFLGGTFSERSDTTIRKVLFSIFEEGGGMLN